MDNLNDKIDPAENPSTGLLIDLDDGWNSNRVSNVTAPESNSNPPEWFDHVYEVITSKSPLETTDAANAEEWALFQDREFIFNHSSQKWLRWSGGYWQNDGTGLAVESVKRFADWIWATTFAKYPDEEHTMQKTMLKKVRKLSDIREIHDCLKAAATIPSLSVTEDMLDCHPELLNFRNGTYDLNSHEFRQHSKDDYLTMSVDFDYDAGITEMPIFDDFMSTTFSSKQSMIDYVYDCLCDSIGGIIHRPVLQFWYGGGRNGKSILWNSMMRLLGPYTTKINFSVLQDRTNPDRAQNEKARLKGIRLVVTSEVGVNSVLSEAVVKDIVSNDIMEARKLRHSTFQFQPTHHVVMVGNHQPQIRESSLAIKRRLIVIPFINTVPEEEVIDDSVLLGSFEQERPAIMNRLIESYIKMQALDWKHPDIPPLVQQYTQDYWDDNDILRAWMDECCELIAGQEIWLNVLFQSYSAWASTNKYYSINQSSFTRRFKDYIEPLHGISIEVGHAKRKFVQGIHLKSVPLNDGGDGGDNGQFQV